MDSNPNFATILSALDMQKNNAAMQQEGFSMQQRVDNFNACTELTNKGIYIPDLIKKIDAMEEKLKALEENPKSSKIDQELFEVMESSVKDDAQVVFSKRKVAEMKSRILTEYCIKDPRFKEAYDDYRRTVNAVYIHQKEQTSQRESASVMCDDPEGGVSVEEGVQDIYEVQADL